MPQLFEPAPAGPPRRLTRRQPAPARQQAACATTTSRSCCAASSTRRCRSPAPTSQRSPGSPGSTVSNLVETLVAADLVTEVGSRRRAGRRRRTAGHRAGGVPAPGGRARARAQRRLPRGVRARPDRRGPAPRSWSPATCAGPRRRAPSGPRAAGAGRRRRGGVGRPDGDRRPPSRCPAWCTRPTACCAWPRTWAGATSTWLGCCPAEPSLAALAARGALVGRQRGQPRRPRRAGRRAPSARGRGSRDSFVYVSGEIGVGAGIVLDGHIFRGTHGWGGEIGHLPVDPDGPPCRCGSRGCLEQYAGQEAILRAAGPAVDVVGTSMAGQPTVVRLLEAAAARRRFVLSALADAGRALGSPSSSVVNLVDVSTVVLGGLYAVAGRVARTPCVYAEIARARARAGVVAGATGRLLAGRRRRDPGRGRLCRTVRRQPPRRPRRAGPRTVSSADGRCVVRPGRLPLRRRPPRPPPRTARRHPGLRAQLDLGQEQQQHERDGQHRRRPSRRRRASRPRSPP